MQDTFSTFTSTWLPHLGASLVLACIVLVVTQRFSSDKRIAAGLFAGACIVCLVPLGEFSLSHYLRVLTGDLSLTGFVLMALLALTRLWKPVVGKEQLHGLCAMVVVVGVVLYPTALGLTWFDLYAHGYYPIIVAPSLLALALWFIWQQKHFYVIALGLGYVGYALGVLDSDNLWDYLVDPVVFVYAVAVLVRERKAITRPRLSQQDIESFLCLTVASFLMFAVYLAQVNHDAFRHQFVVEDGFIEWCTVFILIGAMVVCARRFVLLRRVRSPLFLGVTGLLVLLCLFGAGEEISWGQRIFDLETPDYLKDRNAQGELGLHNLVVEIDGEEVKLNKLIFGTGLALALLIYLFVATPLYRRQPVVTRFFNAIAAPMPRNYHIVGYLAVVAVVELLVDSSKRGEMTEFAGSIIFALNVIYPYNPEIFDPDKPLPAA